MVDHNFILYSMILVLGVFKDNQELRRAENGMNGDKKKKEEKKLPEILYQNRWTMVILFVFNQAIELFQFQV